MSNWIDCRLDVLVTNPKKINEIANALREPSRESLLSIWAAIANWPPNDAEIEQLRELVAFETERDLNGNPNTARRFESSFKSKFPRANRRAFVPDFVGISQCNLPFGVPRPSGLRLERGDAKWCRRKVGVGWPYTGTRDQLDAAGYILRHSGPSTKLGSRSEACGTSGWPIWLLPQRG